MKTKICAAILMTLFSYTLIGSNTTKSSPQPPRPQADGVKPKMNEILVHLTELSKLFFQKSVHDSKVRAKGTVHFKEMSRLFKQVGHEPKLASKGFAISRVTLENHLADMEKVYASGNVNYARWMFQGTMGLCLNCHTQVPGSSRPHMFDIGDTFSSKFMQAEFYFSTREFDRALTMYTDLIQNYPKSKISSEDLETAFERKVAYYARVKRDPKEGMTALLTDLKNPKIPEFVRKNVEAWAGLFREWERQPKFNVDTATDAQLKAEVETLMKPEMWDKVVQASNPRVVTYLRVSGMLYEYMAKNPKTKIMPDILYWLAICDRRLNNEFFFSLANAYLRECINGYPQSPVAKKCFEEFDDEMTVSYSGSGGTHLPVEVEQELKEMKIRLGLEKK